MKKTMMGMALAAVLLFGSATVAFATSGWKTPAEIVSALTGQTVDQVQEARESGTSYGAQAEAAGKLEQFQGERLEQYKLRLDEAVGDASLTQAEADKLYDAMETRMDSCNGDGTGAGSGLGCGLGNGQGNGMGRGMGNGCGLGGQGR